MIRKHVINEEEKIVFPPLHIKLGLMKQFERHLMRIRPRIFKEKNSHLSILKVRMLKQQYFTAIIKHNILRILTP